MTDKLSTPQGESPYEVVFKQGQHHIYLKSFAVRIATFAPGIGKPDMDKISALLSARSERTAIEPPTEAEISAYRDLFRSELDKRMDTKHPSASPSTESHEIALRAFVEARNAKARRFTAPDLSAPENIMRGRD